MVCLTSQNGEAEPLFPALVKRKCFWEGGYTIAAFLPDLFFFETCTRIWGIQRIQRIHPLIYILPSSHSGYTWVRLGTLSGRKTPI